jgi:Cu(I)/Ag(I) efflux system membrane fusion protein
MIRERLTTIVRTTKERPALLAALVLLLALLSGVTGYWLAGSSGEQAASDTSGRRILYWYDPMLPNERYPGPGKSSMGMDLIPKYADQVADGGVTVSPSVMQNLGIRLARVETREIAQTVRSVGRVDFDQRLISEVQTLTPGFVERLTVRAEGEPIDAGRVIAEVYSPELYGAQQEYAALLRIRSTAVTPGLRQAARNRLRLLGLPTGAIQRLERGGTPQRTYAVAARTSGVVTRIGARPGAQVSPGESIVTIQGLGQVLVIAEVPEASMGNIHVGQPVEISFPAYPGDTRQGRVDYIFPSLNTQSRTAQVRITLPNSGGRLKSGMFANVNLQGTGGMATVVPSEAVIDTGRRQVVVVRRGGNFIPQEVRTGRDYDRWTEIVAGLGPGEQVVSSGQFLIDSEASLSGFLSRLSSTQAAPPRQAAGRGIVTSVDGAHRLVSVQHGAIPALGWPAMTMTFQVRQPGMLRGLRRGLRVEFTVNGRPEGDRYIIERIAPQAAR